MCKIPDSCDSRGFRRGSTVNSVIDAIGPIESVTSLLMQLPSVSLRLHLCLDGWICVSMFVCV